MKIREIRARPVTVPLPRTQLTSAGLMTHAHLVLIDVLCDEEPQGRSYIRCYSDHLLKPTALVVTKLGTLLQGHATDPADALRLLRGELFFDGIRGVAGTALAAIEIALWDASAQAASLPLASFLQATPRSIRTYAVASGRILVDAAAEAERLVGEGFAGVKVKLGWGTLKEDVDTVAAVRRAVGDGIEVMVDYNQALSLRQAVDRCHALAEHGVAWVEEPISSDDEEAYVRLCAQTEVPVQLGENWWSVGEMRRSTAAGACDRACIDAVRLGGVAASLEAIELAGSTGLPLSSHGYVQLSSHLFSAAATAEWLEYHEHAAAVSVDPPVPRDGGLRPSDEPGTGLVWNEEAVRRYLV